MSVYTLVVTLEPTKEMRRRIHVSVKDERMCVTVYLVKTTQKYYSKMIGYASAELSACHIESDENNASGLWLDKACFDVTTAEAHKLHEALPAVRFTHHIKKTA